MQISPWNPGDWIAKNWEYLTGWAVVLSALGWLANKFRKFTDFREDVSSTRKDLDLIMTNHLPHLQAELEKVNDNLEGLRTDLNRGFEQLGNDIRLVLTRMP